MFPTVRVLLLFFSLVFSVSFASSQTIIPVGSGLPNNPAALLALARSQNGLEAPGLSPWHLKASYQTFDQAGNLKNSGVFEEWWAGPQQYKRSYASKDFTRTDYVTDTGTYRIGSDASPFFDSLLESRLLDPVPETKSDLVLMKRNENFGTVSLECVALGRKMMNLNLAPTALFPAYCFDLQKPMLRLSGSYGQRISLYNNMVKFQGRYIAQDFTIRENGNHAVLSAHVDVVEPLSTAADVNLVPPSDAVPVKKASETDVPWNILQSHFIKKGYPEYPESAKQKRIEGKILMDVEIDEGGNVAEMTILSAPDPSLAIEAMRTVRQWQSSPFLLNGKPVPVHTQVTVIFRLGG